jgi:periplasmic protein TonB
MTTFADHVGIRRSELVRWAVCFAVVLAAHGAAAMAMLLNVSESSDIGVDTPVVLLDLPESLVSSPTPTMDLPPGPIQEEETEPTPPQKEEIKQPQPEAELALPVPEPPKPEPPVEEKHATAPPAAKAVQSTVTRWQTLLAAHLEHFKRYPPGARAKGEQGIAKVAFTIDQAGHLLSSRIVQSSGSASLDEETLAMLARAQPMPKPPGGMQEAELSFVVPVRFNIR